MTLSMQAFNSTSKLNAVLKSQFNGRQVMTACTCGYHHHHHHHHQLSTVFTSAQCPIWLFSVVPWFRAFPLYCSGFFWMILRWFYLPLLQFLSLLFLHNYYYYYHHNHHHLYFKLYFVRSYSQLSNRLVLDESVFITIFPNLTLRLFAFSSPTSVFLYTSVIELLSHDADRQFIMMFHRRSW